MIAGQARPQMLQVRLPRVMSCWWVGLINCTTRNQVSLAIFCKRSDKDLVSHSEEDVAQSRRYRRVQEQRQDHADPCAGP